MRKSITADKLSNHAGSQIHSVTLADGDYEQFGFTHEAFLTSTSVLVIDCSMLPGEPPRRIQFDDIEEVTLSA